MRTLKENFFGNLGIGHEAKRNLIEQWLKKYRIFYNYTINLDLTIDVDGNVNLHNYPDKELPDYIQFNIVKKTFDISFSNIISLRGCPKECKEFNCDCCENLTSLEGAPKECEFFYCNNCENLTSLEGAPTKCPIFDCQRCNSLASLKGSPKECELFNCSYCEKLTSLKGAPKKCEEFKCNSCGFTEKDVKKVCNAKIIYCN